MVLRRLIFIAIAICLTTAGCGSSGGGLAEIDGPLDLSEAQLLVLNHFYVKEWTPDGNRPFFSVYIKDNLTGDSMVCAGPDDGLSVASEAGVYYGNLSIPMRLVDDAAGAYDTPVLDIVIVADQNNACPSEIADSDDIVATVRVNIGELTDMPIEINDGAAYLAFKVVGHDDIDVPEMEPAVVDQLTVGEIYFVDTPPGDVIPNYYLFLYISNGTSYDFAGLIDPEDMPEMRLPGVIFSWLSLPFADTEGVSEDATLLKRKAYIQLLKDNSVVVGQTDNEYLGDMIGRKVEFVTGTGYVQFRRIEN